MFKELLLTAAFFTLALGAALAAEPVSLSGDALPQGGEWQNPLS